MILLEEHKSDIVNKLKLFDVIIQRNFDIPSFGIDLIEDVMEKAWPSSPPKNAKSLIKSFLKNHYKALKNGKILAVPEKCKGFKIIKVSVHLTVTAEIRCYSTQPSISSLLLFTIPYFF